MKRIVPLLCVMLLGLPAQAVVLIGNDGVSTLEAAPMNGGVVSAPPAGGEAGGVTPVHAEDAADAAFASGLYAHLASQEGNLFFSPLSIRTALAMAYAGARGDTAEQMARVLRFTLPADQLHPAMQRLIASLNEGGAAHGYTLAIANALWLQRDYPLKPDFTALMQKYYGAGVTPVDFRHDAAGACSTINAWVEEKTEHRIKDLLLPGALDSDSRLVLTDAVYFKGQWENQFDEKATRAEEFHAYGTRSEQRKMMHRTGSFNYVDAGEFAVLEIPYHGGDLSMVVLLPGAVDGLPAIERTMTSAGLAGMLGALRPVSDIQLTLPRFKMTEQFDLSGALKAMGMSYAFSGLKADFSGMSDNRDLYISKVIHKAYIDVNEEGTEAAAATAVIMTKVMARAREPKPVEFRADHPFLFLIRDLNSGSILFMGRVNDPEQ